MMKSFSNYGALAAIVFSIPLFISIFVEPNLLLALFLGGLVILGVFLHFDYNSEKIIFENKRIKLRKSLSSKFQVVTIDEIKFWGEKYFRNPQSVGCWILRIVKNNNENIDLTKDEYKEYDALKEFLKNQNIPKKTAHLVFEKEIQKKKTSEETMNNFMIIGAVVLFFLMGFYSMYLVFL